MPDKTYVGRLVCDGDGHLHAFDEKAEHGLGKQVAHDPDSGNYVFVQSGQPSHNEQHGTSTVQTISGTSGPLYDAEGTLVSEGDPHHLNPTPDDDHYDESAPRLTRLKGDPNDDNQDYEGDPTVTGHTEAYRA